MTDIRTWGLASAMALGAVTCYSTDADRVRGNPVEPGAPTPDARAVPISQVETVAEAIAWLEGAIQDVYVSGGITPRQGAHLLELANLARDAGAGGDFVRAFGHLEQAHAEIEAIQGRGQASPDEALRLHQAVKLIGATIVTRTAKNAL